MTLHKTNTNLEAVAENYNEMYKLLARRITFCGGTGCIANGAQKVHDELVKEIDAAGLPVMVRIEQEKAHNGTLVSKSGCQGFCQMGPLIVIEPDGILYTKVKVEDVPEIVNTTLVKGQIIDRLLFVDPKTNAHCKGQDDILFYNRQKRTVLKECGHLDPSDLREYIAHGGYKGARTAYMKMTDKQVCKTVLDSGLRGRGGGGFPTGLKWDLTRKEKNKDKYVICNGDEGDPGAFMDRSVMEGNPHSIIEGMLIAARGIGANAGYVYVRAEYPLAVTRMRNAVKDAKQAGLLGTNLFNSGLSFELEVMEGAGAFVCGEETALMASVEGKRGMPMPKPPFPAQKGLYGKPSLINNVETLACVPLILRNGADWFKSSGTKNSPGTKTFALTGHVANTGLIEVPFGTTLREIVLEIGGGLLDSNGNPGTDDDFKAVQIGGPSGGCLTKEHLDLPMDFDSLQSVGAMVGSGGLVVMNADTCMIKVARFFMQFTQNESCGKCVLCREGTKQMLGLLDDIIEGNATEKTLDLLEEVAHVVAKGSLCGLGKTAPSPVLSTLKHFRKEYEAHIFDKHCPTGQCSALATPEILADKCKGCTICARKCPVNAITGEKKQLHVIDAQACIKCGACAQACRFDAIVGVQAA